MLLYRTDLYPLWLFLLGLICCGLYAFRAKRAFGARGIVIIVAATIAGVFLSGWTAYSVVNLLSYQPRTSESSADWLGFFFGLFGLPAGVWSGIWAAKATDVPTTINRLVRSMIFIVVGTGLSIVALGIAELR